tara:strand:- start:803 stop:985 length:183 start_codon:yes stop_codon:yes gene_type:complete
MLTKKSERSFNEQLTEARSSGDTQKWSNISRRASMAYENEMERLRNLEAKLKEDLYNKNL